MVQEVKDQKANQENPQVIDPQIKAAEKIEQAVEKQDEGIQPEAEVIDIIANEDAQVAPAKEATPVETPEDVAAAGVKQHHEGKSAQEVLDAHPNADVTPAGEHHPIEAVDGSNIVTNLDTPFDSADVKALRGHPNDANLAHIATEKRKGRIAQLRDFLANKFIAGSTIPETPASPTPENVTQFPTPAPAQEVKKAA